jgi:predicted Rossmann fold nucleotide-binding protein DprA/Smf involved in DNA uptake
MPEVPDVSAIAQQVKARITHIEDQLKQHERLVDELDRLRDALTRLEAVGRSVVSSASGRPAAKRATASRRKAAAKRAGVSGGSDGSQRARAAKRSSAPVRAARGENRAKVLDALKGGPMTAGEVAAVTGIGAGTVSTMLNKMAKSGELAKAQRGYQLPQSQ